MLNATNQIAAALAALPKTAAKVGPRTWGRFLISKCSRTKHPKPDYRKGNEVDSSHQGNGQHGAREIFAVDIGFPSRHVAAAKAGIANPIR
jgi:hypothetical protein